MILADENLHQAFIQALVEADYAVERVVAIQRGAPDTQVIELASAATAILLTEDKDFGELVFAHQMAKVTVIFMRYRLAELPIMIQNLLRVIEEFSSKEGRFFIVITSSRIRIRSI